MCKVFLMIVATGLMANSAGACLRDQMDERAVQWSSLIVRGTLKSVDKTEALMPVYSIEVEEVLDGAAKKGDRISVVRILGQPIDKGGVRCVEKLAESRIGKSFLMMLRPAADTRLPIKTVLKDFVIVHSELASDVSADQLETLKSTIAQVREAEKGFSEENARSQAQALA